MAVPEISAVRTLIVTSSEAGEGKTVIAANLAVSLARLNQRVVLIDADLRRPRLHEMFGQENGPGLADVLMGKAMDTVLRKTKVPRLWLMPSGTAHGNPADLLGSASFGVMIDSLRTQVDWVVLDSPPVLAVADPCVIARVGSGVLFVLASGRTSRDVATAAVQRLDAVGANLVGAMLNRAALDRHSYMPYFRRGYESYYSYGADAPRLGTPGGGNRQAGNAVTSRGAGETETAPRVSLGGADGSGNRGVVPNA